MSRSYGQRQRGHNLHRPQWLAPFARKADRRSERHRTQRALGDEVREPRPDEAWLEVLADFHEEHGRLRLAELLRRGRDDAS